MIGCKNKVLWFIYVLIYEDNFPVFSTCVEMILFLLLFLKTQNSILYVCRDDSSFCLFVKSFVMYSLRV